MRLKRAKYPGSGKAYRGSMRPVSHTAARVVATKAASQ